MQDRSLPTHVPNSSLKLTQAKGSQLAVRGRTDLLESGSTEQQRRAEAFFHRHPDWFIQVVTLYYPLSDLMIASYADQWDWHRLSFNKALPWSEQLIERYADRWDWSRLSSNEALPWSEALLERYTDRWVWKKFSKNISLPSSEALIERYADQWVWSRLSSNEALPWSEELLERYADRWVWSFLADNAALPWSVELIERYVDRWHWGYLSTNITLPWSETLIERYADRWVWFALSGNEALPWSEALIERYADQWDLGRLAGNEALPLSVLVIKRIADLSGCNWRWVSENEALPWSDELIDRYADRWEWFFLSKNEGLPWSDELIDRYADQWDWHWISMNKALHRSESFVEKYWDRLQLLRNGTQKIEGIFSKTPIFRCAGEKSLSCFNLTRHQVEKLLEVVLWAINGEMKLGRNQGDHTAMEDMDLASLQNDLAMVDMNTKPQRKVPFGLLEALLIKKGQIKLKMYQEKGHARPHFHVDYGSQNHAASYAIDTGERLDGNLHRKYDRAVGSWAERNRDQLLSIWGAVQAGNLAQPLIASLSAMD